jgi:hypothetical protein
MISKEIFMLATARQSPPPSIALETSTLSATLVYSPGADPGSQLTWSQPFFLIGEVNTTLTVTVENAIFAAPPITFLSSSNNFVVTPINNQVLSIQVTTLPSQYFNPLALAFNVDSEGVNGISSPPLFLVRPPSLSADATEIELQYSLSDGTFTLDSAIVLASLDVLINNITPFGITFNLVADSNVTFNLTKPIVGPSWLTTTSVSGTQLKVSIGSSATRFGSFQFVLDVQPIGEGDTIKVTSPDPIIVNATIGDG